MSRKPRGWRVVGSEIALIRERIDRELEAGRIDRVTEQVLGAQVDRALDAYDVVRDRLDRAAELMEWPNRAA
jgi:hypothetical protein